MYEPSSGGLGATDMTPVAVSTQDKAEMLDGTPWTQDFEWQEIVVLAGYMQALKLIEDGTVFREHDREVYMCLVVSGRVAIFKEDAEEGQRELINLGPGKAFGEIALLDGQPRSATVIATMDSTLMVLTQQALKDLCRDQPKLATTLLWKLARVLTGRLRQTSGALVELL